MIIVNNYKKVYLIMFCGLNCVNRNKDLEFNITEQDIMDLYYKQSDKCVLSGENLQ